MRFILKAIYAQNSLDNEQHKTPKWLKETQLKSWEPEILISGIVLFGLLQVPDLLDQLLLFVSKEITGTDSDFNNAISTMKTSVFWLILGLIIHLITRGIWIGLIGLSFVIPTGINRNRLKFTNEFNTEINKLPQLNKLIIRWEKICSSIFSISFLLFMSVLGAYSFLFFTLVVPSFFFDIYDPNGQFDAFTDAYSLFIIGISLLVAFDFLSFGLVKKVPIFSKIYLPITKVVRILSLSFLYRPIYYVWASHTNRWIFLVVMGLFLTANLVLSDRVFNTDRIDYQNSNISMYYETMGYGAYGGYYQDEMDDIYSFRTQIPSNIIDGNVLRVFLPLSPDYEEQVQKKCDYQGKLADGMSLSAAALKCHEESYLLAINDVKIPSKGFRFHYQQKTDQKGLLTWLDITDIPDGLNSLKVDFLLERDTLRWAEVPFYKTN